jgi:glycine/D-amino acid oxidase-like deaminating enzyme
VVLDRGFIASGASTKNAGFACFGSISELMDDLEHSSESEVFGLLEGRYEGLLHLLELVGKDTIDYSSCGGYELFKQDEESFSFECIEKIPYFNKRVKSITGLEETYALDSNKIRESGFHNVNACIVNRAEGKLNPGKMMQALHVIAKSLDIQFFNGVEVTQIAETTNGVQLVLANSWHIKVGELIVANNGFAKDLLPNLELKAVRNQVLVTSKIKGLQIDGTFHMFKGYYYYRNIDSRILIGGGRHLDLKGETTNLFGSNTIIENALMELLDSVVLPNTNYTIESKWSGILGVGASKEPICIKHSEHITLAVRLGGMGVALGSLLGKKAIQHI